MKSITREKKEIHYDKGFIYPGEIILNLYASNKTASKYTSKIGKTTRRNNQSVIMGDFENCTYIHLLLTAALFCTEEP